MQKNLTGLLQFDALETDQHDHFYESLPVKPDAVLIAFAYNGPHDCADIAVSELSRIINTNYTGLISIANIITRHFIKRNAGDIIIISSVAAERAKAKNYIYGSSKAALSYYIEGLQQELKDTRINVMHVKPGFVATGMQPALCATHLPHCCAVIGSR